MIRHEPYALQGAQAAKLLQSLDKVFAIARENNVEVALKASREFKDDQQVNALKSRVFYAFRPKLNAIAICFRHTHSNFETHLEITAPPGATGVKATCELCEEAASSLNEAFKDLKLKPRLTATIEEDNGAPTNIHGTQETIWTYFLEDLKRENVVSGIFTGAVVSALSICFKPFGELWADAVAGLIALVMLTIFLFISSLIEKLANSQTSGILRWEYE